MIEIGIVLLLVGFVGLVFGLGKRKQVTASNGSVAVGGDSHAPITIIDTGKTPSSFWDVWNIVCGIATLAGLVLTILPLLNKS
ncbi:hypothetical protein BCS42_01140 [Crenothrix sp. D3]|jgi:hypothetical protein|nr:hypothetical protein BCS42_01140 [Crenothrix sp. D3]